MDCEALMGHFMSVIRENHSAAYCVCMCILLLPPFKKEDPISSGCLFLINFRKVKTTNFCLGQSSLTGNVPTPMTVGIMVMGKFAKKNMSRVIEAKQSTIKNGHTRPECRGRQQILSEASKADFTLLPNAAAAIS